ncbi:hypothetical protein [Daejeonella oryzae]|uniref:hypothetical protein n=1 Tax=Daejeonella oryzae TaxID=1122943 RepID=UPI000478F2E4|nr:hypothetical protein [Daejeonella oryzae]
MFNSVALDVVIGLIFIFLLYSLLATVLAEIIATNLGLRARNLKEAIDRMLNDENRKVKSMWQKGWFLDKIVRIMDSVRLMKNPKNKHITNFYNHPEIKYLGSSGIFRNPSSFKAVSFSKTLLYILSGTGPLDPAKIEASLRNNAPDILGKETASYVLSLWEESYGNITRFKQQLEAWFERTMEQATEWYKRKIQFVLMAIGFFLAAIFNADTFVIVKKLSSDKSAREQMVNLAQSYQQNNKQSPENIKAALSKQEAQEYSKKLDSLLVVRKTIDEAVINANTLLGVGSWLPDKILVKADPVNKTKIYPAVIEKELLPRDKSLKELKNNYYLNFNTGDKLIYFFRIIKKHFFGFLLTAIAISLGAPFWFDLLNKLMKLRSSIKQENASTNTMDDNRVAPSSSVNVKTSDTDTELNTGNTNPATT